MSKFTYIEIVRYEKLKVVKRINVTGKSERQIERIESGLHINLAHDAYYTAVDSYDEEQPLDPIA